MTAQDDAGRILVKFSQGDTVLNVLSEAPKVEDKKAAPKQTGTILRDSLASAKSQSGFALEFDPNDVFEKAAAMSEKAPDGALDSPGGGFSSSEEEVQAGDGGGGSGETLSIKDDAEAAAKGAVITPNKLEGGESNTNGMVDTKPLENENSVDSTPSQMEKAVVNSENYVVTETPVEKTEVTVPPIPGTPAAAPSEIKRSSSVMNTVKSYLPTAAMLGYQYMVKKKDSSSSSSSDSTDSAANIQPTQGSLGTTSTGNGTARSEEIVRSDRNAPRSTGGQVLDSEALRPHCNTEPVPEPISLAALAIGGAVLFGRRRLKK